MSKLIRTSIIVVTVCLYFFGLVVFNFDYGTSVKIAEELSAMANTSPAMTLHEVTRLYNELFYFAFFGYITTIVIVIFALKVSFSKKTKGNNELQ